MARLFVDPQRQPLGFKKERVGFSTRYAKTTRFRFSEKNIRSKG